MHITYAINSKKQMLRACFFVSVLQKEWYLHGDTTLIYRLFN